MQVVIIVGAGGHAAEIRDYIDHINAYYDKPVYRVEGFIDDDPATHQHYGYEEPLLGPIQNHTVREDVAYLMGIANLQYRRQLTENLVEHGAFFGNLIHPTTIISPSASIGKGVIISHNASVGPKAQIGDYNFINSRSTIGHDTKIGNHNVISPQVALGGKTTIGDGNMLGTNCCTIPGISIGDDNKIGAGMVVYKAIGNEETVFFRYKERIIAKPFGNGNGD